MFIFGFERFSIAKASGTAAFTVGEPSYIK